MKRILSIPLLLLSIGTYAQTAKQIVLTKGQEITIITNASGDADMGMGMTLTNTSNITSQMIVIGEDENNYSITKSLTNLKMSMEGLGQNMEFNSDNQEDKESEIGKKISAKINNPEKVRLIFEFNLDVLNEFGLETNEKILEYLNYFLLKNNILNNSLEIKNVSFKSLKNAVNMPTSHNLINFEKLLSITQNNLSGIELIGQSSGLVSTSFNDQIIQGLKIGQKYN